MLFEEKGVLYTSRGRAKSDGLRATHVEIEPPVTVPVDVHIRGDR